MVKIELITGQHIDISMTEVEGTDNVFSVTYEKLIEDVDKGSVILIGRRTYPIGSRRQGS